MQSDTLCADRTPASGAPLAALRSALRPQYASVLAWWRGWRRQQHDRVVAETLASLGPRTLHDIGLSDDVRLHALAQRESQYERLARTTTELGSHAGRFGL